MPLLQPGQEKFDGKMSDIRHSFNICTLNAPLPEDPLPGFKQHIAELARDFKNLTKLILQALAIGLDLPVNFFIEKHSHMLDCDNETTFR
jgi:isopenicillin N synthase-like dioxygenase